MNITIHNLTTGRSYEITKDFGVTSITGIGGISQTVYTQSKAFEDGDVVTARRIAARTITIDLHPIAGNVDRGFLYGFFGEKDDYDLKITYKTQTGTIGAVMVDFSPTTNKYTYAEELYLSFKCPSPFFRASPESVEASHGVTPMLVFPLISPVDVGFITGVLSERNTVTVTGGTTRDKYITATITATDAASVIQIENGDGEYVKYNGSLVSGDVLVISFARATAYKNGTDVRNMIDRASTFFAIPRNAAVDLTYSAQSGDSNITVTYDSEDEVVGL